MTSGVLPVKNIKLKTILLFALGALLFVPPYFQGLFPLKKWLIYEFVLLLVAIVFLIIRRGEIPGKQDGMTWAALGLLGSYVISAFVAYNKDLAYLEAVRLAGYFAIFILCKVSVSEFGEAKKLVNFLYWSGVGVAIVSLGTAFGTFGYPGAFVNGRLYGTLQYPNTFAAYLVCLLIPGVYFYISGNNARLRLIYAAGNAILLFGFFGTISRGGYLTLLVVAVLFLAGLNREYKLNTLAYLLYLAVAVFFISNQAFSEALRHAYAYCWLWLLAALGVGLVPEVLRLYRAKFTVSAWVKKAGAAGVAILVICSMAYGSWMVYHKIQNVNVGGKGPVNTQDIVERAAEPRGIQERFVFYQDAWRIIKDHPLLGTGGQGWNSLYRQYQPYNYATSLVHNHYLQVFIEAGVIGFAAFLAVWYFFFSAGGKLLKNTGGERRFLVWTMACAALALGIHSIIDFSLSLPSVAVVLWGCWGIMAGLSRAAQKEAGRSTSDGQSDKGAGLKIAFPVFVTGALVFVCLTGLSLFSAIQTGKGIDSYNKQQYDVAERYFQTAVKFNPLFSDNHFHLTGIYMIRGVDKDNRKELEKSLACVNKAVYLERNNPEYRILKGKAHLDLDQIQEGVQEYETANRLTPFVQKFTEQLEEIYLLAGQYCLFNGDRQNARLYLQKAVSFPEQVEKRINEMEPKYKRLQLDEYRLQMSENIRTKQNEAKKLLVIVR